MTRENVEIAIEFLHVNRHMRRGLSTIDQHRQIMKLVKAEAERRKVGIEITVSGCTTIKAERQPCQLLARRIQTAAIAGVPGTAAEIQIDFLDTAGSACGSLLPTGRAADNQ